MHRRRVNEALKPIYKTDKNQSFLVVRTRSGKEACPSTCTAARVNEALRQNNIYKIRKIGMNEKVRQKRPAWALLECDFLVKTTPP